MNALRKGAQSVLAKLLLVEDDKSLGETLKERLEKEGYTISWAKSLREAREYLKIQNPDLMILDVRLPDGTGFDLAGEMNQKVDKPPFLFLTAHAEAPDRLKGFELGAEEFIPKPFHLNELLLRVKHVLNAHSHIQKGKQKQIKFGNFVINFEKYIATDSSGAEIKLAARDCHLLQLLIKEKERVVSRDEILDKLWGENSFPTNRTIDNAVVRLRQIFNDKNQSVIITVRGVGYRWTGEITGGK